jgi:hypothetical protein
MYSLKTLKSAIRVRLPEVVIAVVSGLLLTAITYIFKIEFTSHLKNKLISFNAHLSSHIVVLNADYYLFVSLTIILLTYVASKIWESARNDPSQAYRRDEFYGLIWEWHPNSNDIDAAYDLRAYCPKDMTLLLWPDERRYYCICCGLKSEERQDLKNFLMRNVQLSIGRRLRDQSWKKAKKRISSIHKRDFN